MPASGKPRSGGSLDEGAKPPQAIVVSRGEVGRNVHRLVMDLRRIMEPFTAPKLKASGTPSPGSCFPCDGHHDWRWLVLLSG